MKNSKINDTRLIRMVDSGVSQTEIAKKFGVTRQAVNKRLRELRGIKTKCIVAKKVEKAVDRKLDAISQLKKINDQANDLLDELEDDPGLKLKTMAEIRGQLKLQIEIFQCLYDLKAVQEFQDAVLEAIGEVSPDVRAEIIRKLNAKRAIRSAVKFH